MLSPDHWQTIRDLVAWIDSNNGRSEHEIAMRIMKITEEAGEVASAYIGMTGQNPRKGVTHTIEDVQDELCDVILTAAVALASLSDDPAGVLNAKITRVAGRAAAVEATR
ncbi:MazG-like family protein [Streptomyces scopuliridis]|uniref:MazG-like family protein n=1 Tax=Streptomyces scopuliridis TaxID=452529 RepID=UPI00342F76F2